MAGKDITVYDTAALERDEVRVRRKFWRKLRRCLARIPFADDLVAAYYCAVDAETPAYVKAVLMGAVAYFVLPADLLPDFIVTFGFTDDAAVVVTALRSVGGHVNDTHRARAREKLKRLAG
ncbi:MAG: YkvA family protein [Alphaproteobacteria bacterium]|nr:YkvA family protein [Alphaproteobacteria bacterium]